MAEYIIKDGIFVTVSNQLTTNDWFQKLWIDVTVLVPGSIETYEQETEVGLQETLIQPVNIIPVMAEPEPGTNPDSRISETAAVAEAPKPKSKYKYSCDCSNVWGKEGLRMECLACGYSFQRA